MTMEQIVDRRSMDLRLNRKSQLPIHVQLGTQLAHLIDTGQLAPGTKLPTVRQVAGFLRVNRNTAARVFAELDRAGYLSCERGRGTFVSRPRRETGRRGKMEELLAVVDAAIGKASRLGFSPEEFSATLYARSQVAPNLTRPKKIPALFVECNRPQLRSFSRELEHALPLSVDTRLTTGLERLVRSGGLSRYAVVVTTFFHLHEIKRLLRDSGIEIVGLLAEASLETLMRLTALPQGTRVGVACNEWKGTENVKLSIKNAGLAHLKLVPGCGREPSTLRRMLVEARVVVCSSLVARRIRAMAPAGTEIIVDDRRLDPAGIEMLRRRLSKLGTRDRPPARGRR